MRRSELLPASGSSVPSGPTTWVPASAMSSNSPTATTDCGDTGPPMHTSSSGGASAASCGTASATRVSDSRSSTTPIAPSGVCSSISTTVRRK